MTFWTRCISSQRLQQQFQFGLIFDWMMIHRLLTSFCSLFKFLIENLMCIFSFSFCKSDLWIQKRGIKLYYAEEQLRASDISIESHVTNCSITTFQVSFESYALTEVLLILGRQLQIMHQFCPHLENVYYKIPGQLTLLSKKKKRK